MFISLEVVFIDDLVVELKMRFVFFVVVELLFFLIINGVVFVGNVLVCFVFYRNFRLCIIFNYYIIFFVMIDLLILVFFLLFLVGLLIVGRWFFGGWICCL